MSFTPFGINVVMFKQVILQIAVMPQVRSHYRRSRYQYSYFVIPVVVLRQKVVVKQILKHNFLCTRFNWFYTLHVQKNIWLGSWSNFHLLTTVKWTHRFAAFAAMPPHDIEPTFKHKSILNVVKNSFGSNN